MDYGVMPLHCPYERIKILDVTDADTEPRVVEVTFVVPLAARREVVKERNCLGVRIAQQVVGEVAPDEPGTSNNAVSTLSYRRTICQRIDSHFVAEAFRTGWLTRRCQTTAHSPSVCGVMCSATKGGITTNASATLAV